MTAQHTKKFKNEFSIPAIQRHILSILMGLEF